MARKTVINRSVFAVVLLITTACTAAAQGSARSVVENHRLVSKLMGREMPYRVVLPASYTTQKGKRYPVVYLLHGLFGNHTNWTDLARLAVHAAPYEFVIVTPEGENGWYTDHATPSNKYESYIVRELIPEIDKKFRTDPVRRRRAISGLSMGGYGALKFGMKYPELFALAGSFSGALGAASFTEKDLPGAIGRTIVNVFGPAGSETRRSNDAFDLVRSMTAEKTKSLPFIYVDCGTEDFLFQNNRDFVDLLVEKRIPHEYRQLPGSHNWRYWEKQVQDFLRLADGHLNAAATSAAR